MNLGVLPRAGIIASILWMPTGYLWEMHTYVTNAFEIRMAHYRLCMTPPAPLDCSDQADHLYSALMMTAKQDAIVMALAPIPFAWIFATLLYFVIRWILSGSEGPR